MEEAPRPSCPEPRRTTGFLDALLAHFWLKALGSTAFAFLFFTAYLHLLKHPPHPATVIPETALDRMIGVSELALPFYLSLWLYLSVPLMLMHHRIEVVRYGMWMGLLCTTGLAIFALFPTAIAPHAIDWGLYPALGLLKEVDAAGNACPSLHVATAVFACYWLHCSLAETGRGVLMLNAGWCGAIIYSTMATKQHLFIDVIAGLLLGLACSGLYALARHKQTGRCVS